MKDAVRLSTPQVKALNAALEHLWTDDHKIDFDKFVKLMADLNGQTPQEAAKSALDFLKINYEVLKEDCDG